MNKKHTALHHVRDRIIKEDFISSHKNHPTDFTRDRKLTFPKVFVQLFRKTVKSLQLSLNETFMSGYLETPVTPSAYTQARNKFKHTAFIELNDDIVNIFYSEEESIKKWNGYRCIAADGSKIILPKSPDVAEEFGTISIKGNDADDFYCSALFECYYDVLNHIAVGSILAPGRSYEVKLATELLDITHDNDLHIYDRHYASYEFLATLTQRHKNYIIRCPYSSFKEVESLIRDTQNWSKVVTLRAPQNQRKSIKEKGLPLEISVRFISVILSTGELQLLVTSLMDSCIERQEFRWLYGMRWEVETFYSLLKGRLCLENFTGKSAEAVRQDCWSTIFISNFETLMKEGTEKEMNAQLKMEHHTKKVNTAVSFNTIKNMAFELFMDKGDPQNAMDKMMLLFKTNPGLERIDREPQKRKKTSDLQSLNYQKRRKKHVF